MLYSIGPCDAGKVNLRTKRRRNEVVRDAVEQWKGFSAAKRAKLALCKRSCKKRMVLLVAVMPMVRRQCL